MKRRCMHPFILFVLFVCLLLQSVDAFIGYAISSSGHLIRTVDAGLTWQLMNHAVNRSWECMSMPNLETVCMVGIDTQKTGTNYALGRITCHIPTSLMNTTDGLWTDDTITLRSSILSATDIRYTQSLPIQGIAFVNQHVGVAVGYIGSIYRTVDAGATWSQIPPIIIPHLNAISFSPYNASNMQLVTPTSIATSTLHASTIYGYAVGNVGNILVTHDGGMTWSVVYTNTSINLYDVAIHPNITSTCITVGSYGTILRTLDGGMTWLNMVSHITISLYSIAWITSSIVIVGGANGMILRSDDMGITWTSQSLALTTSRVQTLSVLNTSVALAVSRDRLFRTNDSGIVWSQVTYIPQMNDITSMITHVSPVLTFSSMTFMISLDTGIYAYPFNVTLRNTGTSLLSITYINITSSHIKWMGMDAIGKSDDMVGNKQLPYEAEPDSKEVYCLFQIETVTMNAGTYLAYIYFYHNSPIRVATLTLTLIVTDAIIPVEFDWIATYWWTFLVGGVLLTTLAYILIRRRWIRIRRYNRRVPNPEYHVSFWRFWCCAKNVEHAEDSSFWSDDYSSESDGSEESSGSYSDSESDEDSEPSQNSSDASVIRRRGERTIERTTSKLVQIRRATMMSHHGTKPHVSDSLASLKQDEIRSRINTPSKQDHEKHSPKDALARAVSQAHRASVVVGMMTPQNNTQSKHGFESSHTLISPDPLRVASASGARRPSTVDPEGRSNTPSSGARPAFVAPNTPSPSLSASSSPALAAEHSPARGLYGRRRSSARVMASPTVIEEEEASKPSTARKETDK